ncbi:hypothetical protein QUB68_05545 [Microcoleus sp. A006_D1]|uniref:hypothetical protein n=1 Tax=Microcoleus sp. A006_D1 TaxID=3055267 RepID=UPI002FCF5082
MITLQYLVLGLTYVNFGLGYLPGLRMNRAASAIVGSDECGDFGDIRPENRLAGDRPKYDRFLAENDDRE